MKPSRAVGFLALALAALVAAISPARAHNKMKVEAPAAFSVLNCTTTNGSPTVTTSGLGNNFNTVQCGDNITGPGIPAGTFVSSPNPITGTSITLSQSATADGNGACNFTGTRVTNTMRFNIENVPNPGPCGPYVDEILGPCNGYQVVHFCVGLIEPGNNYATGRATYDPATGATANPCWTYGDARLGGDSQIETLPDSVVACVGLYQAPGGTALGSHPDSTLRVNIGRSGTTVTLTIPTINVGGQLVGSGGMQVRAANPNETSIAEWRLIVYPNQAAADGDVNTDGFGSSFIGRAVLETGAGVPTGLSTYGGFTSSDFIVQPQGGGKYTLRPIAGLTRNVTVPNANNAVVVMFADPRSVARPVAVPSNTPVGLALLSLALMASGLWVMRSRRRVETA